MTCLQSIIENEAQNRSAAIKEKLEALKKDGIISQDELSTKSKNIIANEREKLLSEIVDKEPCAYFKFQTMLRMDLHVSEIMEVNKLKKNTTDEYVILKNNKTNKYERKLKEECFDLNAEDYLRIIELDDKSILKNAIILGNIYFISKMPTTQSADTGHSNNNRIIQNEIKLLNSSSIEQYMLIGFCFLILLGVGVALVYTNEKSQKNIINEESKEVFYYYPGSACKHISKLNSSEIKNAIVVDDCSGSVFKTTDSNVCCPSTNDTLPPIV